jgi:multicomponent Na+:H+ antiporter subunit D
MYLGMALLSVLCILQGIFPSILYRYLPITEAAFQYEPWTTWNVLQSLMLLGFSGLAFYIMRKVITPHKALNLDFDWFYRLIGRAVIFLISNPLAFIDNLWTNVWSKVGLKSLMGVAKGSSIFDRRVIDGVVDGSATTIKGIGYLGSLLQNGKLQQYLGLMVIIALVIFAFFWYGL